MSTYNQFGGKKAVDNNTKTEIRTANLKPIGKSKNKLMPWIQIDLENEYVITGVELITSSGWDHFFIQMFFTQILFNR